MKLFKTVAVQKKGSPIGKGNSNAKSAYPLLSSILGVVSTEVSTIQPVCPTDNHSVGSEPGPLSLNSCNPGGHVVPWSKEGMERCWLSANTVQILNNQKEGAEARPKKQYLAL